MATHGYTFERRHFRILFPLRERPRLVEPDGTRHLVLDCSEGGLRYRPTTGTAPEIGAGVVGTLHFRGGRRVEVRGTIVRVQEDGEVGVELAAGGIPFPAVWAEQRRLRRRASRQSEVVAG